MGIAFDWCKRFREILVCGNNMSHRCSGNNSAVPASTLRKCDLKFRMATLAALHQ